MVSLQLGVQMEPVLKTCVVWTGLQLLVILTTQTDGVTIIAMGQTQMQRAELQMQIGNSAHMNSLKVLLQMTKLLAPLLGSAAEKDKLKVVLMDTDVVFGFLKTLRQRTSAEVLLVSDPGHLQMVWVQRIVVLSHIINQLTVTFQRTI
jgi:hypothetical protein